MNILKCVWKNVRFTTFNRQSLIQDFPKGGGSNLFGHFFPENCMKIGPRGGEARPKFYYVDLPLIGNVSGIDKQKIRRKNSMFFK